MEGGGGGSGGVRGSGRVAHDREASSFRRAGEVESYNGKMRPRRIDKVVLKGEMWRWGLVEEYWSYEEGEAEMEGEK